MIRRALMSDLDCVIALCERAKENMIEHNIFQWDELYPDPMVFRADIAQENLFILNNDDGIILGCIVLNDAQDEAYRQIKWQSASEQIGVIHRLMVDPTAEGKGAAYEMLLFAEQETKKRGCGTIRLDAYSQNERALMFYKRNGYEPRGTVEFRKGTFFCFEKML